MAAVGAARAHALLDAFAGRHVIVVGDVMLDHFLVGRVDRLSPEAPVPIVAYGHDEYRPGGAANVAINLRALGARVRLVGPVGDDESAHRLREMLRAHDVDGDGLVVDRHRPTTRKLRIVTQRQQQVARVDYESDADVTGEVVADLVSHIDRHGAHAEAIVVSDYLKGCVVAAVMDAVRACASASAVPVLVDPKIPHLARYRGVTVVTPNASEAETATHLRIRGDNDARDAARLLKERLACTSVVITRGEHGMWVLDGQHPECIVEDEFAAVAREVSDVTGAGDTVIATLALSMASGASLSEGAALAAEAAGLAVSRFGPVAVTADELRARFGQR